MQGWDTKMIEMLHSTPSKKPLLSVYPASFDRMGDPSYIPVICKSFFNWQVSEYGEWPSMLAIAYPVPHD